VPLAFVSLVWLGREAALGARATLAALALLVVASWPIPWTHWFVTRTLDGRRETLHLAAPVAPHLPPGLRTYARAFDTMQAWLIERSVGMRHQEHRTFWRWLVEHLPSREEGAKTTWDERPVMAASNVGVIGWVLPHVAILDGLGLNDYVVARTPAPDWGERRQMAHERRAPGEYERCYRPNLLLWMGRGSPPTIMRRDDFRERPLTDADIAQCEARFRALVDGR
jgi:arabinofuranosyltransferase